MARISDTAGEAQTGAGPDPATSLIAGHAVIAAWDGASALTVVVRDAPALSTAYLFCEGEGGRHELVCRRRLSADGDLELHARRLPPGLGAVVLLRRAGGDVSTLRLRFDASLVPAPGETAPILTLGGVSHSGVNRMEEAGSGSLARVLVGPFLRDEAWRRRKVRVVLAAVGGQLYIEAGDAFSGAVLRVAFVSRRAGWRFIEPDADGRVASARPGEGEAVLLLGAPGASLSLQASDALVSTPDEAARELAVIGTDDGALVAVVLDAALRAATGSALARLDGSGSGRALTLPGQALPVAVRTPFSPYDPNVQAARRAMQDGATGAEQWPDPAPWTHPFAAGGWPGALTDAVAALPLAEQVRLVEWTSVDPLLGRLMAAVKLSPDRDLAAADAERLREAITPLAAPDAPDMLRTAAVSIADPLARRRVLEVASELGRSWMPLSLAEAALAAARVEPAAPRGRLPAETAQAARALIARWEVLTGDIGLLASFDPAQDPLAGASRLLDAPALAAAAAAVPVLARIAQETDRQVAEVLAGAPDSHQVAASLKAAGRYLALRHLVALADVAAGLARPRDETTGLDEDATIRRGVLRRMRAALPEGIAVYLAVAGAGAMPPVERQMAERWGQP